MVVLLYNYKVMKMPFVCKFSKNLRSGFSLFFALVFLLIALNANAEEGETTPVIIALGDSLTAGFGVREEESYPARLQVMLKQNGYPHRVINAGVSGDTTAGGLRRLAWQLRQKPRIVILELGANDGLRGLPVSEMFSNLEKMIRLCQENNAKVLLVGMKIPPNYGEDYAREFENVYVTLAKKYSLDLIPFMLEGVAAKREYTQADGIHPLGPGYEIVTHTTWRALKPML